VRSAAIVRALAGHALLDRVVRGRAWIPLLGVMLAGIVAMQVEVLKLGASMGRSIGRTTALQSRNEMLRASVASLADEQRIERLAYGMGMVMPAPDDVTFLAAASDANARQAIAGIHAPDRSSFTARSPSSATNTSGAAATGVAGATGTPAGTTSPASAAASTAGTSPAMGASTTAAADTSATTGGSTTAGAGPSITAASGATGG